MPKTHAEDNDITKREMEIYNVKYKVHIFSKIKI